MSRADLDAMINSAQLYQPQQTNGLAPPDMNPRAVLTRADSVRMEPIDWLWPEWLAKGKLHVMAGAPGTGKTTLALAFAAVISCGGLWPDRTPAAVGSVAIWSGEDDPADVLVPRLAAMGADLTRVHFVSGIDGPDGRRAFDPARDVALLAAKLGDIPDLRLMVVDPIVSAVAGDSHHNAETRRSLQPLVDLAAVHRCALVGITHLSKGTAGRDPVERVTGSVAFGALARVVLMTVRELTEDGKPGRRMLVRGKSNIGPDTGGYVYDLRQGELSGHPGIYPSAVVWGNLIEGSARELLAAAEHTEDSPADDSTDFLRELLAEGRRPAKEIYAEAEQAGYSRDQMKRAKARIGVTTRKLGMNAGWVWVLPSGPEGSGNSGEGWEGNVSRSGAPFAPFGGRLTSGGDDGADL